MDRNLDRRAFLMGSAGIGMAVLAGGALAGCSGDEDPASAGTGSAPSRSEDAPAAESAPAAAQPEPSPAGGAPVYFTADVSAAGLMRVWDALGAEPAGRVAVKLLHRRAGQQLPAPRVVGGLVRALGGTIVECNTAYGGARTGTERHLQVAAEHGFTALAEVDIMDADGSMSIPVEGGAHLTEDLVGAHLADYDFVVSLAHFKGHAMGGFGGALKNCSIGIASSEGKVLIHSAGASTTSWGNPAQDDFLESMAEAAKAVSDHLGERMCYVNVMNRLSVDCDCDSHPAEPDMADIGILASTDPVALDRACVDLVYAAPDGASLVRRMESLNGPHILEHAEAIGLGSQAYELVDTDA